MSLVTFDLLICNEFIRCFHQFVSLIFSMTSMVCGFRKPPTSALAMYSYFQSIYLPSFSSCPWGILVAFCLCMSKGKGIRFSCKSIIVNVYGLFKYLLGPRNKFASRISIYARIVVAIIPDIYKFENKRLLTSFTSIFNLLHNIHLSLFFENYIM